MSVEDRSLVNWSSYAQARAELGANFARILGYFREDGLKSVDAIEAAMRARSAAALVVPAHTLKGEARQFGADTLGDLAEAVEMTARDCVERHDAPDMLLEQVVALRPLFNRTLTALEREANPLVARKPAGGFGRRVAI
ncbi:Hpt domain-containing protein [Sphingomonas sp.]|uniref:Hpt domain-containing protein n=1 Tax=Sphingomonas sp. TaxID=28214 RepID=UPI002C4A3C11|nr:Hpt domain-containing protein [Sphingomonas sp.]HTG39514.1 Hpt domain-containing protein [Sphingomonas sp.]